MIQQESNLSSPILKLARSLLCIKPLPVYLFTISIAGTGFGLSAGKGDGNLCSKICEAGSPGQDYLPAAGPAGHSTDKLPIWTALPSLRAAIKM